MPRVAGRLARSGPACTEPLSSNRSGVAKLALVVDLGLGRCCQMGPSAFAGGASPLGHGAYGLVQVGAVLVKATIMASSARSELCPPRRSVGPLVASGPLVAIALPLAMLPVGKTNGCVSKDSMTH